VQQGITDAELSEDSANNITIRTKLTDLIPAPTPQPTVNASASASAVASAGASAGASAAASAAASASASALASAQASAGVTAAPTSTPSPSPSPSASPSATPNSVDQAGKACALHLPTIGPLAKVAAALQADPKLGPIACTGMESTVGPIVSSELIQQAVLLILFGSLGILIWIGIRFGSIKFGATALAALLHDVIVVVGTFAILGTIFGVQIDALFVTAMLTVIGFSVHDTIVVYDRIRETRPATPASRST